MLLSFLFFFKISLFTNISSIYFKFTCNNFSTKFYFNCWSGNISNFHLSLTLGFSSNFYAKC